MTLSLVPDDGGSMNTPAPESGAIRIAAVDQLFASDGTEVAHRRPARTTWGGRQRHGHVRHRPGRGLIGPNGQPLTPAPTPPGQQTSGSMLPLILPVQKAYGNLYPNPPVSMPMPTPAPTPAARPDRFDDAVVLRAVRHDAGPDADQLAGRHDADDAGCDLDQRWAVRPAGLALMFVS